MIAIFPEIAASAAAGDVERLAILVRRYFGGGATFAPRPPIAAMLDTAGLTVRRMALDTPGALLAKDERGAFSIVAVVADRLDAAVERFLLAHMLGHYLLDVQPLIARGDWQVSGFREAVCPLKRYCSGGSEASQRQLDAQREARADQFAAALLLPRGMVKRALEKMPDTEKVAAFFGVPRACLLRRMQEMGLVANDPVNFLDAERQIGSDMPAQAADDDETQRALLAPADGSMPRSYAASTYGAMEKSTRTAGTEARQASAVAAGQRPPGAAVPAREGGTQASSAAAPGRRQAPSTATEPQRSPGRAVSPAGGEKAAAPAHAGARPAARSMAAPDSRPSSQPLPVSDPAIPRGQPESPPRSPNPGTAPRTRATLNPGRREGPTTEGEGEAQRMGGMDRLRELARKLDKSVPE